MSHILDPFGGRVDDSLDLHGMRGDEVAGVVTAFIRRVHKRQPGALVHVITGKGRRSAGQPVLITRVKTLLKSGALPVAQWATDLDRGGYLVRLAGR